MIREEAIDSIKANIDNENSIKHMLASEAIMRALARHLGEDEEEWGITGLLHDIDMELTQGDMKTHSKLGADLARELGTVEALPEPMEFGTAKEGESLSTTEAIRLNFYIDGYRFSDEFMLIPDISQTLVIGAATM